MLTFLLIAIPAYVLASIFNAFEVLMEWPHRHEKWQVVRA